MLVAKGSNFVHGEDFLPILKFLFSSSKWLSHSGTYSYNPGYNILALFNNSD